MINVGLVGFGLSGRYLQAPFFIVNPEFRLSKIVTSQVLPSEIFAGTSRAASMDELLNDPEIELISICSPNSTHYEYAKKALLAGKHVLVEKPASPTAEQTEELYRIAEEEGKVLAVFQNRRFDSDFLTVLQVIKSGVLGEILSYEAHFDRYKPILNAKLWKETPSGANGILYDLGAHLVDQALFLFGTPVGVTGEVFTQRDGSTIDDAFNLNIDFGKTKVNLKSSLMVKSQGPKYIVHGTLGSFTKSGMDVQEDHLVAGVFPTQSGFGIESADDYGKLVTHINGLEISGTVQTFPGNWNYLFKNLAHAILQNNSNEVITKKEEIITQIKILDCVKNNKPF